MLKIWYKVKGSGTPCFLLHGGPGIDSSYFHPYLDPLAKLLKLYFIDLRGCGQAPRLAATDYTMQAMVEDLEQLRQQAGHDKIILCGHSFGGFLALEYALAFPERVVGLILVASAAHLQFVRETGRVSKRFPQVARAQREYMESDRGDEAFEKLIFASIPLYFSKNFELEAERLLSSIHYGAQVYAALIKNYHSQFSLLKELVSINAPSLVIAGKHDLPIPPKYSRELVEHLPNADYAELTTGHFPFVEKPAEFNKLIINWCRKKDFIKR